MRTTTLLRLLFDTRQQKILMNISLHLLLLGFISRRRDVDRLQLHSVEDVLLRL